MIAEPYICIKGKQAGTIEWLQEDETGRPYEIGEASEMVWPKGVWERYADFEREKLKALDSMPRNACSQSDFGELLTIGVDDRGFFVLGNGSGDLIGYTEEQHTKDSESSRLLKRAEFLKAVCQKESIEWLPKQCNCSPYVTLNGEHICSVMKKPWHIMPSSGWMDENAEPIRRLESCICFKVCNGEMLQNNPRCPIHGEPEPDYYTKAEVEDELEMLSAAIDGKMQDLMDYVDQKTKAAKKPKAKKRRS